MKKRLSRLVSSFHGSSCKSKSDASPPPPTFPPPPLRRDQTAEYIWRKEDKWHVVVCSGHTDHKDRSTVIELKEASASRDMIRLRPRISTSSSRDSSCCITSEDEANDEETSTLLASLSFATANPSVLWRNRTNAGEGKVGESFAVVKKSEDPRGDFRRSMAEMVAEKGMYGVDDLEQLLHCFLSLNPRRHHRDILAAFTDIWETLFPENPPAKGNKQ